MQNRKRTNKVIVKKIIDYCNDIEKLQEMFGKTFSDFNSNFAFQYAVAMCVVQIGELTTRLSEDFKEKNSEIEWSQIKGLRNIYVHDYENVKLQIIWDVMTKDVPTLKENLQAIYLTLNED